MIIDTARWSDPELARRILTEFHVWAVVGASPDPARASHGVTRSLMRFGYEVVPVYPRDTAVHGLATVPDLRTAAARRPAGSPIEVVDIFRASHRAGAHVDEAIEIGARAVWLQLGVWDEAAAERAAEAGLLVVMDRCPAIDYPVLVAVRSSARIRRTELHAAARARLDLSPGAAPTRSARTADVDPRRS